MKTRGMTPLRSNQRGTHFLIREGKTGILENLRIPRPRAPRFVVHVRLSERAEPGTRHPLSVVQRWNGRDVGRINILLRRPQ